MVQMESANLVAEVLTGIKETEISKSLDGLTPDQLDALMKYIYCGFATYENCNTYLKWHAQVVSKAGLGTIVRALAERKSVVDMN